MIEAIDCDRRHLLSLVAMTIVGNHLVRQQKSIVDRTLAIDFLDAGVETFAFTFG